MWDQRRYFFIISDDNNNFVSIFSTTRYTTAIQIFNDFYMYHLAESKSN